MNKKNTVIVTLIAAALTACGGGGGGSSSTAPSVNTATPAPSSVATSAPTASPAPTAIPNMLVDSAGNLNRYLGSWRSGCLIKIGSADGSVVVFNMTSISNVTEINLSLTTYTYKNDLGCTTTPTTQTVPATFKYISKEPLSGRELTGYADKVQLKGSTDIYYFAFDSLYKTFRFSSNAMMTTSTPIYKH